MRFAPPFHKQSIKIMLLGSGELGKEVAIEAQRLGLEVIAVDRYENAPAHQVAHKSYVIDMLDKEALLKVILHEKPDFVLPEVEAINIDALFEAEKEGLHIIPNANAVALTMNRKKIRIFAAKELGVPTSAYLFVKDAHELKAAADVLGYPCVVKPVMSSSGHGQSIVKNPEDIEVALERAKEARGDASELIVEEFIDFDYEITLLTIKNDDEVHFCRPIGHKQIEGDFVLSWQPMHMSERALKKAQAIAKKVVEALGGRGIFGVEFFIKGEQVYFSELSPRPHDTGMVTLMTQSQSEFALHLRAVLNLPLGFLDLANGACAAFKAKEPTPLLEVPKEAFGKESFVRIFGKPSAHKGRRLAVVLVANEDVEKAKTKATRIVDNITQPKGG